MPSDAEIEKIIALHESGKSQREIAEELGKVQSTISVWMGKLRTAGLISDQSIDQSKTKKAVEARKGFCAAKRIALIDKGFNKLDEILPTIDKPAGMRDWFVALGTAIDKRRLEQPKEEGKSGLAEIREHLRTQREAVKGGLADVPIGLQGR